MLYPTGVEQIKTKLSNCRFNFPLLLIVVNAQGEHSDRYWHTAVLKCPLDFVSILQRWLREGRFAWIHYSSEKGQRLSAASLMLSLGLVSTLRVSGHLSALVCFIA